MSPHPSTQRQALLAGMRLAAGAPAAVLFAGMLGFGAVGHSHGLDPWLVTLCSVLIYALPGQLVMFEMLMGGASWLTTALAVTLTSSRFVTMVVTLFPQLHRRDRNSGLYASVHLLAMTSWALSMREFQTLPARYRLSFYLGTGLTCLAVSGPGTWLGYLISGAVPLPVTLALVFLNPLFFLLTFTDVKPMANRLAIGLGCVFGPMLYALHPDSSLLTTGLIAGTAGYWLERRWRRPSPQEQA
jgi:predicted branched-subunit amino acid permease